MRSEKIASLSREMEAGAPELETELEALRAVAHDLENNKVNAENIAKLGSRSFEALVRELADKKEIGLLSQIAGMDLGKDHHKLLKKYLHRLKSQGVLVPEKSESVKVSFPSKMVSEWAMATPAILMNGQQLIYYFFTSGALGSNFLIIHTDPELGMLDFKNLRLGESQSRRIAERSALSKEIPVPVVAIGREHLFWLLGSAKNKTRDSRFKSELAAAFSKIKPEGLAPDYPEHPAFKLFDPEKIRSRPGLGYQSDRLLEHAFFKHWSFDDETVKACGQELDQASHSPLQLSEPQLLERMESVFEKHARSGLEKSRSRVRSGLLENGYLLELGKESELAEIAVRAALDLEQKDQLPDFFKKIMIRAFPEAWEKMGSRTSPLIISAK
jgi:hypothetical protein